MMMKSPRRPFLIISLLVVVLLLIGSSFTLRRQRPLILQAQPGIRRLDDAAAAETSTGQHHMNDEWTNSSTGSNGKHYPETGEQRNCSDWKNSNNNNYTDYYTTSHNLMDPCHDDYGDDNDGNENGNDQDNDTNKGGDATITTEPGGDAGGASDTNRGGQQTQAPAPTPPFSTQPPVDTGDTPLFDSGTSAPVQDVPPSMSDDADNDNQDYFVYATVYVRLKPNQTSIEPVVTTTCTELLNETLDNNNDNDNNIVLYLSQQRQRREEERSLFLRHRSLQLQLVQPPNPLGNFSFNLFHVHTESNLVVRQSQDSGIDGECDCWWWEYRLQYATFFQHNSSRVTDPFLLQTLSDRVRLALYATTTLSSTLEEALQKETGNDFIIVVLDLEDIEESNQQQTRGKKIFPVDDATLPPMNETDRTANGTITSGPTYAQPLNANEWDWRRYFGLALFVCTCMVSLVYIDLQYHYHHRYRLQSGPWQSRRKQQSSKVVACWMNLASEEGVNELLKTGWKVQQHGGGGGTTTTRSKTTRRFLEIYDKSKWGYEDDDSMLMGGYQQREGGSFGNYHVNDVDDTTPESVTQTTYEPTTTQPPSPTSPSRSPVAMSNTMIHASSSNNGSGTDTGMNSPSEGVEVVFGSAAARTIANLDARDLPPPPLTTSPPPAPPS
jgi:hypothetical protein